MSDSHTPGRVATFTATLIGADGHPVAVCRQAKPRNTSEALENARRLAAAWNALAGLTTAEIENDPLGSLGTQVEGLERERDALREQNAELLEACAMLLFPLPRNLAARATYKVASADLERIKTLCRGATP